MNRIFACLILGATLMGCATPPPTPVTAARVAGFQKGVTTEAEVISALGPPITSSASMNGGKIISYSSMNNTIKGATFIPVVGLFAGGADIKMNSASFTFDAAGKLSDYNISDTAYSANTMGVRQPTQ